MHRNANDNRYCDHIPPRKMCGREQEGRYASTILECLELKIPCLEVSDKCETKAETREPILVNSMVKNPCQL
jgi:hypothetical protein